MMDLCQMIPVIIIGTIEGITEFLPISSTGHIIIISHWLKIDSDNTQLLSMFIQFGSALAIACFFYKNVLNILDFNNCLLNKKTKILHVFVAILPTILSGLIFYKKIKILLNINDIMYALVLGSFFLIFSELLKPKKNKISNMNNISLCQAIIIGLFQVFCLYPGISRSGVTIATGILLGIKKTVAIEFSFIISIPLLMGSALFEIIQNIDKFKETHLLILFSGFIISFIISTLFIKKLLKIINETSMIFFGIYRLILAILIYFVH
ncbi:UDP pyrophosphate phosphatase [Buchnera aphidicola (Diuraphis noxia)]|uniref:Undecaprenyl-diphosphatase n=1 Tax=Buchnera aphidicola subsp. Diuraphis noxia TaxID=118101 RepID=A0A1B2H7Z1_BUCDN|nr:undecaprenyl-diphosphate phosphatase [Buchnera aphidicola]ANZ22310.1 UDP pyrophosphate phosphatase [Buchnera aphidicola (Diuraphis noxia)]